MISRTDGSGTTQYIWDFENRLRQVIKPDGTSINYKYDALGRRSERYIGANSTKFTYDGDDVILDVNSDGSFVKYLNGLGIDDKIRQTINGQAQYFVQDHLGSTNALSDTSGNVVSSATYDSFGNITGNLNTRYEYTGREKDAETGLYFYRNRWYSSELGRFISEDPIGLNGGINQFGYVSGNPANFSDPFGQDEYSMMERLATNQLPNRSISEILDELQLKLTLLGLTPVVGEPFDAADGVICLARGDYAGAILSGESVFPFVGTGAGIIKIAKKADNALPKGGVYRLVDESGDVMRTGRSKNLARREAEHGRDSVLEDFKFEAIYRTDNYAEMRGLEEVLFKKYNNADYKAPFDFGVPISERNKNKEIYRKAAKKFLKKLK